MNKRSKNKIICSLLCLCFIAVFLLSLAFTVSHAGHSHDNNSLVENCAICVQISSVKALISQLFAGVLSFSFVFSGLWAVSLLLKHFLLFFGHFSPAALKIRLNN